jgi:hypothetical protein
MKNLIEFQLQEFRRNFTISRALIIISLITFAFMIHFLSTRGNNEFWIAISMRLYYSPIIYTAIFAGFYISILVSIIVAIGPFIYDAIFGTSCPHSNVRTFS